MQTTQYRCQNERRREAVRLHSTWNGIDFLDVLDHDAPTDSPRQRTLLLHCLRPVLSLTSKNVRIDGGVRITPVRALYAFPASAVPPELLAKGVIAPDEQAFFASLPAADRVLVIRTDAAGDYSIYRLTLVSAADAMVPPDNVDPQLAAIDFSFKVECPSDFDCAPRCLCPPALLVEPVIDYLAKDYGSFRRLMLDRLSVLTPQWGERNVADLGVALVEILAYVGDHLSYEQDVVATEAYLGTARRRVSVRRHARLVDYFMHDGSNARVWVAVEVGIGADGAVLPGPTDDRPGTQLLTRADLPPGPLAANRVPTALNMGAQVFETLHDLPLYQDHNSLRFYSWGDKECCLPAGATRATLRDHLPNLRAGMVLMFQEVIDPQSGDAAEADPHHRHAVRLTDVTLSDDPLGNIEADPPNPAPVPVTEIAWDRADALPFPLCLSARVGATDYPDVSIARGNIVLADHGRTIIETLDPVPAPNPVLRRIPAAQPPSCAPRAPIQTSPRYRPTLREPSLTHAATVLKTEPDGPGRTRTRILPFDPGAPAAAAFVREQARVLPAIALNNRTWLPQRDLLASTATQSEFVVETEEEGRAALRFGDGQHGQRPPPGTAFVATYRVGNGARGNVGAETIRNIVTDIGGIISVTNPMPARGGVEPESIEDVRQKAPSAFRTQQRAVTAADYATIAQRFPGVQRAAATFRWTGSWHTVFLAVDRAGGLPVDGDFRRGLRAFLEPFRMAGHDLEIDTPISVALEMEMHVCVQPDYFRADVRAALREIFTNQAFPDGRRGLFHPDNFTFGQTISLSPFYAAAQAVPGVASVTITALQRQGVPSRDAVASGRMRLGRLEIARIDDDPNFPEHGLFRLVMEDGK